MKILHLDKDRFMIKEANPDKITGKWREVTDAIIEVYKKTFGENLISVNIGGSIACGEAVENKSDVDSYAIINLDQEELKKIDETVLKAERRSLNDAYPFQKKIEMHLYSVNGLGVRKQFQLRLLATCVFGKNYDNEFPNYPLTRETFKVVRVSIPGDIEKTYEKLKNAVSKEEIESVGRWIAKRLIRDAGTLVLWKGNFYTMNIPLMAEIFTNAYPEKKVEIDTLIHWIDVPPQQKDTITNFLEDFGKWLVEEDKKVFEN